MSIWKNIKSEIRSLGKPDFRAIAIKALLIRIPLTIALIWASPIIVVFTLHVLIEWIKDQSWLLWPWTAPMRYLTKIQDRLYKQGSAIARQKKLESQFRALNEVDTR